MRRECHRYRYVRRDTQRPSSRLVLVSSRLISVSSRGFHAARSVAARVSSLLRLSTPSRKYSPALYELRTIGPLATYKNPIPSAISRYASNASGVRYSTTGDVSSSGACLPERDDVHVRVAEQSERANHLRASLAQPEHETRLRDSRPGRLGHLQHLHGLVPVSATIANVRLKLGNRLHVVREDVQSAPRHAFHETRFASKIGRERLDENVGRRRLEVSDGGLDVIRALVLEIVAVDAGQHDVVEAPLGDGLGDVRGFVRVQRRARGTSSPRRIGILGCTCRP